MLTANNWLKLWPHKLDSQHTVVSPSHPLSHTLNYSWGWSKCKYLLPDFCDHTLQRLIMRRTQETLSRTLFLMMFEWPMLTELAHWCQFISSLTDLLSSSLVCHNNILQDNPPPFLSNWRNSGKFLCLIFSRMLPGWYFHSKWV